MKREWEIDELVEHFSLSGPEMTLLHGKTEPNQLGLAILLKYFQYEGQFPDHKRAIPRAVVTFIAEQLAVDEKVFDQYSWKARTISRERILIRQHLGFREAIEDDRTTLTVWLTEHAAMQHEHNERYWLDMAYHRLRELHIEPFSVDKMERIVQSALNTYQDRVSEVVYGRLSETMKQQLTTLLDADPATPADSENPWSRLAKLKEDPGGVDLKNVLETGEKLRYLRTMELPDTLFADVDPKWIAVYCQRATAEPPSDLKDHPDAIRYTLLAAFCQVRQMEITDQLIDLLIQIIHRIGTQAERKIDKAAVKDIQRIYGKHEMLVKMSRASLSDPQGQVKEVIFGVVSADKLQRVVDEHDAHPLTYRQEVAQIMNRSYGRHYRRMLSVILDTLQFRSNNPDYQPVLKALKVVEKYMTRRNLSLYPLDEDIPLEGVVRPGWREVVVVTQQGKERIRRLDYELCVLGMLRETLRATEIWVEGANKYGNPDKALPTDFTKNREHYSTLLNQPLRATEFIARLKALLKDALTEFNKTVPNNPYVKLLPRGKGHIRVSKLLPQPEPPVLPSLKTEIGRLWSTTHLLDILKEADWRVHFTDEFKTIGERQILDATTLRKRLLLCLFGLGTNIGLKQASTGDKEQTADDLLYIKRYFVSRDGLRNANRKLVNAILDIRLPYIWGEGSVACASDSSKFAVRGENLKSEWHNRYHGRGIMVYWHVERKSLAIYCQLKSPSSSEVAAMIEGIMRHATTMNVERNYVDTHGQSEIAFAFSYLLGFELLPRLKNLAHQKLCRPDTDLYPNLEAVLAKTVIDWELIEQQYELIIQYAAALLVGTADAETILKRFTQTEIQHPTYAALAEVGKVIKTIFLCQYLNSEALRREIEEGLNIIEHWNNANDVLGYGRSGEFSGRRLADHELSMLALQLLQNSLIYINTLMLQQVLAKPYWFNRMTAADWRALTPLFYAHISLYGTFKLEMDEHIPLERAA